jgi:chromosome partitioning protein
MAILLMINLKGGVAKTTNAVAIAEGLASQGYRTLLVDADHQCMAGELLLGEKRQLECERKRTSLYDLLAAMLDEDFEPRRFPSFVSAKGSNIGGAWPSCGCSPAPSAWTTSPPTWPRPGAGTGPPPSS